MKSLPPVALIAGPTASGKSALALALAERVHATIVNADSAQVYRDLSLVSARPTTAEEARAPHRLYGHRDGAQACSAAAWAADARTSIDSAHVDGRLPVLVGGTGLYLRTLIDGIAPVPDIDPEIRAAVRALPVDDAYRALAREDPPAAARLRPGDTSRVARALEIMRSTARSILDWQRCRVGGIGDQVRLLPLVLLPPRDRLFARADERFATTMMSDPALAEVERLLARELDPALPVMRAIGVPEIAAYLRGEAGREETTAAGQLATRRYAKRQYTWFRNQPPAAWPRLETALDCGGLVDALAMLAPRPT